MRDSKRLDKDIIEAGRSGGHSSRGKFESRINRGNLQHIHEDMLVERERMFMDYGWNGRSYQDRLGPLRKYLRSNVGRPWDDVYSDLKRSYDARSMSGWHMFGHICGYVMTWAQWVARNYMRYNYWRGEFYVDQNGTLCVAGKEMPSVNRRVLREQRKNQTDENGYIDLDVGGKKKRFRYLNGCWFAVEYEVVEVPVEEWDGSSMKWDGIHYVFTRKITRIVKKDHYISQRQLNKKELVKFGLTNDPTFSDH